MDITDYLQNQSGTEQYTILANRIVNASERYRIERNAEQTRAQLQSISDHSVDATPGSIPHRGCVCHLSDYCLFVSRTNPLLRAGYIMWDSTQNGRPLSLYLIEMGPHLRVLIE